MAATQHASQDCSDYFTIGMHCKTVLIRARNIKIKN